MTTTVGTSGYINSVTKMDKTTAADGTLFDAIHQQLLNNDAFLNAEIMGMIQKAVNSGVVDWANTWKTSGQADNGGLFGYPTTPNQFGIGKMTTFINGILISPFTTQTTAVTLDPPPTANVTPSLPMSARDDLVFLEMWLDATTGAPKWRIRVVDGVDFGTYTEGFVRQGNAWGGPTGQGGLSSPITYASGQPSERYYFHQSGVSSTDPTATDAGLYVAGKGDSASQSQFNTLDGYVYAIPLFRVRRRNNAGFDPDNNPMGALPYFTTATGSYIPGATSVTVNDASGFVVGDYIYFGSTPQSNRMVKITAISGNTLSYTQLQDTSINTNNWAVTRMSERPDGLYSNIIDASDIVDLRHQVSLTGFNYQALLEKNSDLLLRGQLTTNATQRYGRDYIGLNTGSYTDDANTLLYLKFDGSMVGTANGSAVANTKFGSSAETYANGAQGQGADFRGLSYGEQYNINIPATNWTIEGFFKPNFSGNSGSGTLFQAFSVTTGQSASNLTISATLGVNGVNINLYNPAGTLAKSTSISMANVKAGDLCYFKLSYDGSTLTVQLNEVVQTVAGSNFTAVSSSIALGNAIYGVSAGTIVLDLVRVSNIVRSGTPLPANFSYTNGDRILDGANGDFSMWSDDVGGTTGVNGRTNPYGLSRVPNQVAARVAYNGQEIRHYYGNGITAGWINSDPSLGTKPTGSFEYSGESQFVHANETVDGTRTTFTFTKPTNSQGLWLLYMGYSQTFQSDYSTWATPTTASIDSNGNLTATYPTAPASGKAVQVGYATGARHAHFIPSTKGFLIHDWTDDQASGTGSQTVFQTTKYNVTSVNHVRVGGTIQNGGYSTNGLNAQSTLTAGAAQNATTITVASASNFVANQNIRIANGDGTWYTTTITSISGNTLTVPVLTKALTQNATVQGAALVTFTTAPVAGTNNIDIVYESVLTPSLGDYIRVMYQATPYQGIGNSSVGFKDIYVPKNGGIVTTMGTGSVASLSVPYWLQNVPSITTNLPLGSGVTDAQLKRDTINLSNNTVSNISKQFTNNEQIYETSDGSAGNIYTPNNNQSMYGQVTRGFNNEGGSQIWNNTLRDLATAIPHMVVIPAIAIDSSTGELYLLVITGLQTGTTNRVSMDNTTYSAIDLFKLQGRPLIKGYGGVAA